MDITKKDRIVEWEKEHVQRVLDYHNRKYQTHIEIKGKSEDVYPKLMGQLNWDWVCYDTKTSENIALEIKSLTDPKLEKLGNLIWQILLDVQANLQNKLPGIFSLSVDVSKNFRIELNQKNKQEMTDVITDITRDTASGLINKNEANLTPIIKEKLSFGLPEWFTCNLVKISEEGSILGLASGQIGFQPFELTKCELNKLEELVKKANSQLQKAGVRKTFLVFIEEGYRHLEPASIVQALEQINPRNYSEIKHIYFMRAKKVTEISPPIPVPAPACSLPPEKPTPPPGKTAPPD